MISSKQVDKIALNYHCRRLLPAPTDLQPKVSHLIWGYNESLILDREAETLTIVQNIGTGCDVTKQYHAQEGIPDLIDSCSQYLEVLTVETVEQQKDVPYYELEITYYNGTKKVISGMFNRCGLPEGWSEFAEDICDFIDFYGFYGDVLNPYVYERGVKRNEYIYCSVSFEEYGKTYYYMTDDITLKIGDKVIVPVGVNNREVKVTIENIEYFKEDELPMSLDKVKAILRRVDDSSGME